MTLASYIEFCLTCDECGQTLTASRDVRSAEAAATDFADDGWKLAKEDVLCPECAADKE